MKIFITVGIFPPDIGGPASFVPKVAQLFVDNGNEVKVLCLSDEKHDDHYNYDVIRIMRFSNKVIRWPLTILKMIVHGYRADVWFINGLPMEAYIAHKFSSVLSMRKIKTLRKVVGDWAWERGRNLKLTEDSFDDFQKNKHSLHLEIAKFSRGWTAKKVNKIIVPSQHLKGVVQNWGVDAEKIDVLYNGTKITNQKNKHRKGGKNLISVGRLAPWKNIDVIIDSIEVLNQFQKDRFSLTLVGDGPMRDNLEEDIDRKGLSNQIEITGQVPSEDVQYYLNKADIYLQASGYEGLPHVILEAINHSLTIISTPIGGTNEILRNGECGWVLPLVQGKKPNSEDIVRIVKEVLRNEDKDQAMKEAAFEMIDLEFNEDKNLKKYLEYIN